MIGVRNQALRCKAYVKVGLVEATQQFYGKKETSTDFSNIKLH
jgi:hypothetical protein